MQNLEQQPLTRRSFLSGAAVSAGAIGVSKALFPAWMPRLAFRPQGAAAQRDVLVCIFLRGGIDGLATVPPFGEGAPYYDVRPTQHVREPGSGPNAAIDLDGFFGLHPALAPLKEVYDEGDLGVIQATGSTDPTRSHFDAMLTMEYGTPGVKTTGTGWLARHLQTASWQNDSPFRAVGLGDIVPSSLAGSGVPLALKSIADFHLRGREDEAVRMERTLRRLYQVEAPTETIESQAAVVFETLTLMEQLNAESYQPAPGADYPDDTEGFGLGLRQIAQLIKADVGLEVACIDLGGWDTHENQGTAEGQFAYLLGILGQGLNAFYTDLADRKDDISVVTMSEFGRTVIENASAGTDHGYGSVMFLMGGGVRGGMHANWPTLQRSALVGGDLAITMDYRDVLAEVLLKRVGNAATADVFPGHTLTDLNLVAPRT